MTDIKVGDRVTYRRPYDGNFMYMGIGGCVVKQLHNVGCTEPTATLEWRGYKETFDAPIEWLTKED